VVSARFVIIRESTGDGCCTVTPGPQTGSLPRVVLKLSSSRNLGGFKLDKKVEGFRLRRMYGPSVAFPAINTLAKNIGDTKSATNLLVCETFKIFPVVGVVTDVNNPVRH